MGGWLEGVCIVLEMDCNSLFVSFWGWLLVLCDCFLTFSLCTYTLRSCSLESRTRHVPPLYGSPQSKSQTHGGAVLPRQSAVGSAPCE